jgi:hypothetical protein
MISFKNVFLVLLLTFTTCNKLKFRTTAEPQSLKFQSKITESCLTYNEETQTLLFEGCNEDKKGKKEFNFDNGSLKLKGKDSKVCPKINDHDKNEVQFNGDCPDVWKILPLGEFYRLQVTDSDGEPHCITAASREAVMVTLCEDGNEDQLFKQI